MDVNVSAQVCIIVSSTDFSAYHLPKCGNYAVFKLKGEYIHFFVMSYPDRSIRRPRRSECYF